MVHLQNKMEVLASMAIDCDFNKLFYTFNADEDIASNMPVDESTNHYHNMLLS